MKVVAVSFRGRQITADTDVNRISISGVIVKGPDTRVTPAGIPITRFILEHRSIQMEAGLERQIQCRTPVVASGTQFQKRLGVIKPGERVSVKGFLNQTRFWGQDKQLVIHVTEIE